MAVKVKFYLVKIGDDICLTKYQLPEQSEWLIVDEQHQNILLHQALCSRSTVNRVCEQIVRKRTISVSLSEEEARPYLSRDFGDIEEEEEDEDHLADDNSQPPSTSSHASNLGSSSSTESILLHAVSEMMKAQQEMFTSALKSFQDSITIRKLQKLDISKFDGKSEDATTWMKSYEKMCDHNGWLDNSSKINGLKSNLDGNALKWYNSMVRDETEESWDVWKSSFLGSFGQNRISAAIAADKWEYRGGPVLDYFFEKQRLIQIGYPALDDFNFNTKVMLGLPEEMQIQLMAKSLQSKKELRAALEQLKPSKLTKPLSTHGMRTNKPSIANQPNQKRKENLVAETLGYPISTQSLPKGATIDSRTQLMVNGKPFSCRLDSGADFNLIDKTIVILNSFKTKPCSELARTFDGSVVAIEETCNVNVTLFNKSAKLSFGVVNGLPHSFVIGENSLKDLGIGLKEIDNDSNILVSEKTTNLIKSIDDIQRVFPSLCSKNLPEPKFIVPFALKLDHKIVQCKPYRLSDERYNWVKNKIAHLLEIGVIRESDSPYASPITLAKKENGDLRFCTDFRQINDHTTLDPFPFPIIDDIINRFGGCNFFSKIDLKDGFWQIGLTPETRQNSAFVTPFGHYEWNRLPFGWKNSPAIFQRWISKVLEDTQSLPNHNRLAVYIDDICVGGKTEDECAALTYHVLSKLAKAGMIINVQKTQICVPNIKFLGRIIDGQTKTTRQESIDKVEAMPRPYDVHTLRQFTGLTGHFRAFIKGYSNIVRPLERLKQKDVSFEWTDECESSFALLKSTITQNPILQLPDADLPYELCTDACGFGTGSILYQRDTTAPKARQLRVIGYQSYTFNKCELNYMITEKEALAVIKAVKYFRSYLEGKRFVVHTDHIALKYLMDLKEPKGRLARWQMFLMGFEIVFNHKPGRLLTDADALSRLCNVPLPENLIISDTQSVPNHTIVAKQNHKIFVDDPDQKQLILKAYHDDADSGGHDGFWRSYLKIKSRFSWPKMKQEIYDYVRSCHVCQLIKPQRSKDIPYFPDHSRVPFEVIHIDFGEFAKKSEGVKTTRSFLLVVDEATRSVHGKAMKENSRCVKHFLESLLHLSKVKVIVSDNGTAFTSKEFKDWSAQKNIKLRTTSPYHPAANGLVERRMKDIKQYCKLYAEAPGNWKDKLAKAIAHSNRSFCSAIGCSPLSKLLNKPVSLPADSKFGVKTELLPLIQLPERKTKGKENNKKPINIKENDLILVKFGYKGKERITKGPFKVVKVYYFNKLPKTVKYLNNEDKECTAHIANISIYHDRCHDS